MGFLTNPDLVRETGQGGGSDGGGGGSKGGVQGQEVRERRQIGDEFGGNLGVFPNILKNEIRRIFWAIEEVLSGVELSGVR
jgi:hypothetical protein